MPQVAAIAASIKEWGWTTPALVGEDGGLIAGHARILAARQLGIAEIPVMVAAGWSEAQKRAYVLAESRGRRWRRSRCVSEFDRLPSSRDTAPPPRHPGSGAISRSIDHRSTLSAGHGL